MAKDLEPSVQKIGKYIVIDVIGTGGMGIVYRARDAALNRTVAIKMLKRSSAPEAQAKQVEKFFNRELLATASLQHRNIVTVYESGEEDGDPYLVMECLDGEPVSRIIAERRPMPLVEKLDILIQVCDGLQYAHDRRPQVIHRDIKPANVILLKDGTAKLVDFGIARIAGSETAVTQTGQLVGSLSYMSPEQINSSPIDSRTDIFSAGVLAYELLAYTLPFRGSDPGATFVKILRENPEPLTNYVPDIPPELVSCIDRALAKKPEERFQTAEEFGFELLSVQKRLKQSLTNEYMQRAETAARAGDLERAKHHLLEITKLDRHHERANRLLVEVRRAIQSRERAAHVMQMRSQAQVALAGQQYEEALACIEQALQLDSQDAASLALRDEIQKVLALHKNVRELLRRAESAMLAGDLDEAQGAIRKAISFDAESGEARALGAMIESELAERSRRSQVQHLVDSAREGISRRQFGDAIDSLRKAEELDPADSNVRELLQWARRGKEQELRRKELVDLTEEIERALRAEDFSSAFTICELAISKFPNEQTLRRLHSIAERQKEVAERRRYVQDQSLAARDLMDRGDLDGAITQLEAGLAKIPAEPNFEALLTHARRLQRERETSPEKHSVEVTAGADRQLNRSRLTEDSAVLRKALDERELVEYLEILAVNLTRALGNIDPDEQTRRMCEPLIQEVRARKEAKQQTVAELEQLRRTVSPSADAALRNRAAGRIVEAKAAFPRERDIRVICDEISKVLDAAKEERGRVVAELSEMAKDLGTASLADAKDTLTRALYLAGPHAAEPQVGALIQQITFEVERREKRLQSRICEIGNLERMVADAPSLESISQLLQNAISVSSPDAEDPAVAGALNAMRSAADERRREISDCLAEVEEISNRALTALNVEGAEQLLEEAKSKAAAHPNIDEIQRAIVRVTAQVRGRRVEHDLVANELQSLTRSVGDENASTVELDSIGRRAGEVQDKYSQERTILSLCRELEASVKAARDRLLHAEIARIAEEQSRFSGQAMGDTQAIASSVRKLQDLVQAFPDSVELRSFLLKAQESLSRTERTRRETAMQTQQQGLATQTGILPEVKAAKGSGRRRALAAITAATVLVALGFVGWTTYRHSASHSNFALTVETSPAGAEVQVNGQRCASTPCTFRLPAGSSYEADAQLAGYTGAQKTGTLTEDNRLVLELQKQQATAAPVPTPEQQPGKLIISGLKPTDRVFVDESPMNPSNDRSGWPVKAGFHRLKLMDGNQELVTDPRQFRANASVTLSRAEFKAPAPATSQDDVAWNRIASSQDIGAWQAFVRTYPNSPRRAQAESILEELYWSQAAKAATVAGYKQFLSKYPSPQGIHYSLANSEIDRLEWQGLQNSTDASQLNAFLGRHPNGPYHGLAIDRLDDLAWNSAKSSGTLDSFRGYLSSHPNGRHRDEANGEIAQLTKPEPQKPSEPAPVRAPVPAPGPATGNAESDDASIRRILDGYQDAYESRSIEKLRAIWPTISSSQASILSRLFRDNDQIRAPYSILNQKISGDEARVTIQQFMQLGGRNPRPARMTIVLKRNAAGSPWTISSIQ